MERIQFRRDTKARWLEIDPILMEGEWGLETDTRCGKIGDGVHKYSELEYGYVVNNITQMLGDSKSLVMSQDAITSILGVRRYPEFSEEETYIPGDVVSFDGKIYRFITDHSGSWNESRVQEISILDNHVVLWNELDNLYIDKLSDVVFAKVPLSLDVVSSFGGRICSCGKLFVFGDTLLHSINQVFMTIMTLDDDGQLSQTHTDGQVNIFYRTYGISAPNIEDGKWTKWTQVPTRLFGGSFLSVATPETSPVTSTLRRYKYQPGFFYIAATPGTYRNFNSDIILEEGEIAALVYSSATDSWTKNTICKIVTPTYVGQDSIITIETVGSLSPPLGQEYVGKYYGQTVDGLFTNLYIIEDAPPDASSLYVATRVNGSETRLYYLNDDGGTADGFPRGFYKYDGEKFVGLGHTPIESGNIEEITRLQIEELFN